MGGFGGNDPTAPPRDRDPWVLPGATRGYLIVFGSAASLMAALGLTVLVLSLTGRMEWTETIIGATLAIAFGAVATGAFRGTGAPAASRR